MTDTVPARPTTPPPASAAWTVLVLVSVAMFGLLSLFGLVFAWLLRRREVGPDGHHLERPVPRSKFEEPAVVA